MLFSSGGPFSSSTHSVESGETIELRVAPGSVIVACGAILGGAGIIFRVLSSVNNPSPRLLIVRWLVLAGGLLLALAAFWFLSRQSVRADENGVRWRTASTEKSWRWGEIQSLSWQSLSKIIGGETITHIVLLGENGRVLETIGPRMGPPQEKERFLKLVQRKVAAEEEEYDEENDEDEQLPQDISPGDSAKAKG